MFNAATMRRTAMKPSSWTAVVVQRIVPNLRMGASPTSSSSSSSVSPTSLPSPSSSSSAPSSSSTTTPLQSTTAAKTTPDHLHQGHDLSKSTSFAMSGCGWLSCFYFGVIERMREGGYLTTDSLVAGTSGGSLGALIAVSQLHPREGLRIIIEMSRDRSFRKNIDKGLKSVLPNLLDDNIVDRCNKTGNLNIVVTKLWPNPKRSPLIINKFESKAALVDVVAASCFIPLYSSTRLTTRITGHPSNALFIDGGVFGFMPPIGDVRVSPFSIRPYMMRRSPNISIRPGVFSTPRLLSWVLNPAPPGALEELYVEGYRAADEWIQKQEEMAARTDQWNAAQRRDRLT